jgi:hypothetical protein
MAAIVTAAGSADSGIASIDWWRGETYDPVTGVAPGGSTGRR